MDVNLRMPYFVVEKAGRVLGLSNKSLRGAKVLVLGVTYKRDIPDDRESPAEKVIQLLMKEGAQVSYHDPFVPEFKVSLGQNGGSNGNHSVVTLKSVTLDDVALKDADIVIITTDHTSVDYQQVADHAQAVLDTRNATRSVLKGKNNIWRL